MVRKTELKSKSILF